MKDSINQELTTRNWRTQTVGEGEYCISIGTILNRIDNGYYQTKKLKLSLEVYNLRTDSFGCGNLFEFLTHYELVRKSQLKYPIIINNEGQVIDGRHRICKAILEGRKEIEAIQILDSSVI